VTRPQTKGELESVRAYAYDALRRDPDARNAHLRLYEIEQMLGQPDAAIGHLRLALRHSRIITLPAKREPAATTILALTRVARWEANTPLELIVDDERTTLHRYYIDDNDIAPGDEPLPPYDVLFNTIAESESAANALDLAGRRSTIRRSSRRSDAPASHSASPRRQRSRLRRSNASSRANWRPGRSANRWWCGRSAHKRASVSRR
jgi:hypothetical protein